MGRSSPQWPALLAALALLAWPRPAHADLLKDSRLRAAEESKYDVAFTLTARIHAPDVDALSKCLANRGNLLSRDGDPKVLFRNVRWKSEALQVLDACRVDSCKFDFPRWAIARLEAGRSIEEKKQLYYRLVQQVAWSGGLKRSKRRPIRAHRVIKTEACADHDRFHWLLNGDPKAHDRVIWRKHFGGSRIRPTLTTLQISSWKKGDRRCVGGVILFADHYYFDGVELLELVPQGRGVVALRFHRRDRINMFGSWLLRRFRWKVRDKIRNRRLSILRDDLKACGAR